MAATLNIVEMNNVHIVEVVGRLDGNAAPDLARLLDETVDAGRVQLVLDLGSVEYISSAGLREIVRIFKRVQTQDGDLRIANPSEPAMTVMELAGLDTALGFFPTRTAAVQSFG